ncbi:MAG TPA: DUF2784 domain-containing protein [Deltaproteobacteria bacterium]|nr:DUF2784 domain-containing protein [Deltaproteobacteria bacterium]
METAPLYAALADLVMIVHAAFVLFVVLGGFLVARFGRLAWLHIPCVVWGVVVEVAGLACPLTPLENLLRVRAGLAAYGGDFVLRFLEPVIYPACITRPIQYVLGLIVAATNVCVYGWIVTRSRRS